MAVSLLSRFDSPFSVLSVSHWVEWLQIEEFFEFWSIFLEYSAFITFFGMGNVDSKCTGQ
jgi:hypothetical protein